MSAQTAEIHFELYTERRGRWTLDACFADEDEARAETERVARRGDVRGARLVREVHLRGMAEPIVTVIVDTTEPDRPLEFRVPGAAPSAEADANAPHPGSSQPRAQPGSRGLAPAVGAPAVGHARTWTIPVSGALVALLVAAAAIGVLAS